MTDAARDEYPGGWFGASWGAPVNEDTRQLPAPVGEPCTRCGLVIKNGDQGVLIPGGFVPRPGEGKRTLRLFPYDLTCWRAIALDSRELLRKRFEPGEPDAT